MFLSKLLCCGSCSVGFEHLSENLSEKEVALTTNRIANKQTPFNSA